MATAHEQSFKALYSLSHLNLPQIPARVLNSFAPQGFTHSVDGLLVHQVSGRGRKLRLLEDPEVHIEDPEQILESYCHSPAQIIDSKYQVTH